METALSGCPDSMRCYQTLGEIQLYFDDIPGARERKSGKIGQTLLCEGMTEYERSLCLDTAVADCSFRSGNTLYRRQYFASKPADCIVMRFTAEGEGTVDFLARLRRGKCFDGVRKLGNDGILLYGNLGRGGYEFAMALRAQATGGSVKVTGECLQVEGAREAVLYFTADTTYHYSAGEIGAYAEECLRTPSLWSQDMSVPERQEYEYQQALQSFLVEKLEERFQRIRDIPYGELLEGHIKDYKALYDRFAFELEGAEQFDPIPTDERLGHAKEGNPDIGLSQLLLDFGRYLTVACSRPGGLPSTLQGLWNREFFPPWDSKYTININTEMNYWHVESCNLAECHLPLFDLLQKVRQNGRRTAREMYGCRGFVAHHNTDIHGDAGLHEKLYSFLRLINVASIILNAKAEHRVGTGASVKRTPLIPQLIRGGYRNNPAVAGHLRVLVGKPRHTGQALADGRHPLHRALTEGRLYNKHALSGRAVPYQHIGQFVVPQVGCVAARFIGGTYPLHRLLTSTVNEVVCSDIIDNYRFRHIAVACIIVIGIGGQIGVKIFKQRRPLLQEDS